MWTVICSGSLFSGSDVTWSGGVADEWPGTQPANCATEATDSPAPETQADDHTRDPRYSQWRSAAQTTQYTANCGRKEQMHEMESLTGFKNFPVDKEGGWCMTRA